MGRTPLSTRPERAYDKGEVNAMKDPNQRLRWLIYGTEDWISEFEFTLPEPALTTYLKLLLP